jgi:hypothetical protein
MNAPITLTERRQWVLWRAEGEKGTKVPYAIGGQRRASSTDPRTWAPFDDVWRFYERHRDRFSGVGYVFSGEDGLVGVDLDDCRDPETGELAPWARAILDSLNTYCEVSPSGTGVKAWARAATPDAVKTAQVEIYPKARYFAVTGQRLEEYPAEPQDAQDALDALVDHYGRKAEAPAYATLPPTADSHRERWARRVLGSAVAKTIAALDGEKHDQLLGAARLAAGAMPYISEQEIEQTLYDAIRGRAADPRGALTTIRDGIRMGAAAPLDPPTTPTTVAIVVRDGRPFCPSCGTAVRLSNWPYPGEDDPGWYCPECKGPMKWPRSAFTPVSTVSPESHRPHETAGTGRGERSAWKLYTYEALGTLPPIQWLVERRIIAGGLTLLYGPSGTGKSFRALHYALSIAEAYADRSVVYIAPEGGQGYRKRAEAWSLHTGRPVPTNIVWLLDAPRLDDPAQHAMLVALLAPLRPILVIIDTLARCAVGLDENSARDMGILINGCDELRKGLAAAAPENVPCGVTLVHHTGKSGTGYRGSSALIGAADMAIELTPDGDIVREECAKAKDDKPFDPVILALKPIPEADSCVMVPATGRVDILAPLSRHERKVLEVLNLAIFQATGAKSAQVQEAAGIPKASIYRLLSNLKERGYLTQHAKGDPYFITAIGSRVVSIRIADSNAEVSQVSRQSHNYYETSTNGVSRVSSVSPPYRGETDETRNSRSGGQGESEGGYTSIPGYDDQPLDDPDPHSTAAAMAERFRRRNGGSS